MTTTHSYTFDKLGRIGDDECNLSQRNVQNAEFGSYSVQNYFLKYCGMKNCESFWSVTRRDEKVGFPPRLRSNEVRHQKGRNPQGRLQPISGEAADSKTKNSGDFLFQNISTVS